MNWLSSKRIEKINLKSINIDPEISDVSNCNDDIFVVLDDVVLSESDIGTIKNLLSQKIVIFTLQNLRGHVFERFNLNIRVECGAPGCRGAGPGRPQEQVHCLLVELRGHEARGEPEDHYHHRHHHDHHEPEVLRGRGVQGGWQQG